MLIFATDTLIATHSLVDWDRTKVRDPQTAIKLGSDFARLWNIHFAALLWFTLINYCVAFTFV